MKEKIIQGGIVNGVKMLVCPTWEEDFQTEIHKTGGCLRISMNYSAVDVSYWKELEEIAERYGYDLDEEAKEIINEYVKKYEQFDDMIWMRSALYAPSACSTPSIFKIASTSSCVTPYVLSALISIRLLSSKYVSPVSLISGSDARIPEKNATPSATINKIDRNRPGLFRISI